MERERERERDRQTERDRERQRETERVVESYRERGIEREETDRDGERGGLITKLDLLSLTLLSGVCGELPPGGC